MAENTLGIVISAIDRFSGVLTGLNSGLSLLGKAFDTVRSAATITGDAIVAAISVAAKGGAYQEIRDQLENVARSFGVDADNVVRSIQRINQNMSTLPDAAKLAGRGIALGLNQEQLETFFTFIKKRTELTGESFEAMSETVFRALASGRGKSIFQSFGIVVKEGETINSLLAKLKAATAAYGETTFNAADKISALSAQQANFVTKLGQAINAAPTFQKILERITDAAVNFVETFDPRQLTGFFDFLSRAFTAVFNFFVANFPKLGELFSGVFGEGKTAGESFSKAVVQGFFSVFRAAGNVVNGIIDLVQGANVGNIVGRGIDGIIQLFSFLGDAAAIVMGGIVSTAIDGFRNLNAGLEVLLRESPTLAEFLGVTPEELALLDQRLEKAKRGAVDAAEAFSRSLEGISGASEKIFRGDTNKALESWRVDLGKIDAEQKKIIDGIDKIDYSKPAKTAVKPIVTSLSVQLDEIAAEKATEKIAKEAEGAAKKAMAEAERTVKNTRNAIKTEFTEIGKVLQETFAPGELSKLTDDLFRIEQVLKGPGFKGVTIDGRQLFGAAELEKTAEEIRKKLQFKATIVDEVRARGMLEQIRDHLDSVNWPSEFQALGEFLLNFILQKASGDALPLAITTAGV